MIYECTPSILRAFRCKLFPWDGWIIAAGLCAFDFIVDILQRYIRPVIRDTALVSAYGTDPDRVKDFGEELQQ